MKNNENKGIKKILNKEIMSERDRTEELNTNLSSDSKKIIMTDILNFRQTRRNLILVTN